MTYKEIRCIIANNLRLLRRFRDISCKEAVGKRVSVTGQQIQKYEVGNSSIPLDKFLFIVKALKTKLEMFFTPIDIEELLNGRVKEGKFING